MARFTQISFESIPKDQASYEFVQSKAWQEMVELGGRICQLLDLPKSTGRIYGLLYLSAEPLSLKQMSSMLGISKGSASMGTRQLASLGAVRKVWIPGDRRGFYKIIEDLGLLIRGSYNNLIKPKIESSKNRLDVLKSNLGEDFKSGSLPLDKKEILQERINELEKIHNRVSQYLPLIEKIVG